MIRNLALSALAAAFILSGCTEKETPAPVQKTEEVKPPPPPPVVKKAPEPRAEKECAAPIETGPAVEMKIGDRAAVQTGTHLTFKDKDTDGTLTLGVIGPLNEDSGENLVNIKKYLKFFADEKADAIVITGDVGEAYPENITRVLLAVAESNLPVFTVIGNRECRAAFTDGVTAAQRQKNNIVNLNAIRAVEFPEATLVSLPGYHDAEFIACKTGCVYYKSTVDEAVRLAKEAKSPVVLVSHGPPHGDGSQALDFAHQGGNVGDMQINRAIAEGNIPFGLFANIKEAGARAVDSPEGTTLVGEDKPSKKLYLNPGPADAVGWDMNDGTTSSGMVAVFRIKGDEASWKLFRVKPLTAAEKKLAAQLQPQPHKEDEPAVVPASDKKPAPAPAPGE
ncbi:MAG: metallophosphoesterase [Myxococcaceae bacterium]|nr:metallophosphoesterase [Myxococcaceae bacterium]